MAGIIVNYKACIEREWMQFQYVFSVTPQNANAQCLGAMCLRTVQLQLCKCMCQCINLLLLQHWGIGCRKCGGRVEKLWHSLVYFSFCCISTRWGVPCQSPIHFSRNSCFIVLKLTKALHKLSSHGPSAISWKCHLKTISDRDILFHPFIFSVTTTHLPDEVEVCLPSCIIMCTQHKPQVQWDPSDTHISSVGHMEHNRWGI